MMKSARCLIVALLTEVVMVELTAFLPSSPLLSSRMSSSNSRSSCGRSNGTHRTFDRPAFDVFQRFPGMSLGEFALIAGRFDSPKVW